MDSPIGRIAIPAVAAAASAYSPRYGAAGVQGGLAGLSAVQNWQIDKARTADLNADRELREEQLQGERANKARLEAQTTALDNFFQRMLPQDTNATGGSAPATAATIQDANLKLGDFTKPNDPMPPKLSPEDQMMYQFLRLNDPEKAGAFLFNKANPAPDEWQERDTFTTPQGERVLAESNKRTGAIREMNLGEAETNLTDRELWERDSARYAEWKKASEATGGASPNYQQLWAEDPQGNLALGGFNQRTNRLEPTQLPSGWTAPRRVGQDPERWNNIGIAAQALAGGNESPLNQIVNRQDRTAVFARTQEIRPGWDTTVQARSVKTKDSFTFGKDGLGIQSFGTFVRHADQVMQAVQQLENTGVPILNKPMRWFQAEVSANPKLQALRVPLAAVGKEYEGFLLNQRALYVDDREEIKQLANENMTGGQFLAALKGMGHVAIARYGEMAHRYTRGTNGQVLQNPFSPEAMQALRRFGLDIDNPPPPPTRRGQPLDRTGRPQPLTQEDADRGFELGGSPIPVPPRTAGQVTPTQPGQQPPTEPPAKPRRTDTSKSGRPIEEIAPGQWIYTDVQ